jgi:transketolase
MKSALPEFLDEQLSLLSAPDVVTADLAVPLGLEAFRAHAPDQFIDVGISEQVMVAVAAGLASLGRPVIATTFAVFMMRAFEIIRNLVVLDRRHVVLLGAHAGIATGPNGPTHHAVEDIGLFLLLPNLRIFLPASTGEAKLALASALSCQEPCYVRVSKWVPEYPFSGTTHSAPEGGFRTYLPPMGRATDCEICIYGHGASWPIVRNSVDLLADQGIRALGVQIFEIQDFNLPRVPSGSVNVLAEDASKRGGIRSLLVESTGDIDLIHVGAKWPAGSDDGERLYRQSGLVPAHICKVALAELGRSG